MKTKHYILATVLLLTTSGLTFADRTLERVEILQIFEQLTSQPRKTWIPAGAIEATHEEYRAPKTTDVNEINRQIKEKIQEYQGKLNKVELTEELQKKKFDAIPFNVRHRLSNEYTMSSTVIVRFDGERFCWEINVDSRIDSVKPGKNLAGNFMTKQFDLDWNARRIFAWDGEKYTTYFLPGNHAIVDTANNTPHVVNGPLTAGIIPWGYGYYTYENLSAIESSGEEKYIDGQTQVHLTLSNLDGSEMLFVLDPAKDYAVLSNLINDQSNTIVSKQYSNYQLVSGNWIPTTILLERYEAGSNRLLAHDLWEIASIDANVPESYDFEVSYEPDALIEYFSPLTNEPVIYRHSDIIDMDQLLAERLTYAANEGTQPQNCATISLKYVASQLGVDITDQQLAQLVNEPNGETSLYEMKQFAQGLGFYCRAVKTDIQTLKSLNGCEAILHIPGKKHFVVLDSIDDKHVWTVDLASNKFYYRTDIDFFSMDWTDGTALLVSNNPIMSEFADINYSELQTIIGAAGYSCTRLLQEYHVVYCNYIAGGCDGWYQVYYTKYGCEAAESGSCSISRMLRYAESPCIVHPYYPDHCTVTGEWTCYYMRACA